MAWAGAAPSSWPLFPHCPLATTPTLALGQLLTGRSWSQSPYLRDFLNTQPKEAPIANILSCMMLLSFAAFNPVCHYVRASQVALVVKNPSANAGDIKDVGSSPGQEDPLGQHMATHSSILAWRILWTEEPGRLQSMELQRVRHN